MIKNKYEVQEWLTGCPCCGSSQECDCDLDEFYELLDDYQQSLIEDELEESDSDG